MHRFPSWSTYNERYEINRTSKYTRWYLPMASEYSLRCSQFRSELAEFEACSAFNNSLKKVQTSKLHFNYSNMCNANETNHGILLQYINKFQPNSCYLYGGSVPLHAHHQLETVQVQASPVWRNHRWAIPAYLPKFEQLNYCNYK